MARSAPSVCPFWVSRLWGVGCLLSLSLTLLFLHGEMWLHHFSQGFSDILSRCFVLHKIDVHGLHYTSKRDVLKAGQFDVGESLWCLNVDDVRAKIERLPWVSSVSVKRLFPERLFIRITERTPFALWQQGDKMRLLDTKGQVIQAPPPSDKHFIVLVGKEALQKGFSFWQFLHKNDADFAKKISVLHYRPSGRWDVYLKDGLKVCLPCSSLSKAMKRLRRLEKKISLDAMESVDLRLDDRVILTPLKK